MLFNFCNPKRASVTNNMKDQVKFDTPYDMSLVKPDDTITYNDIYI